MIVPQALPAGITVFPMKLGADALMSGLGDDIPAGGQDRAGDSRGGVDGLGDLLKLFFGQDIVANRRHDHIPVDCHRVGRIVWREDRVQPKYSFAPA